MSGGRHLRCPYCESYDVERLYLASTRSDSCRCNGCGVSWDEERSSGDYRGRGERETALTPPT